MTLRDREKIKRLDETFDLNYEKRTSYSFSNVTFDTVQGIKTAIVVMNAQASVANTPAPLAEQEADNDNKLDDCP